MSETTHDRLQNFSLKDELGVSFWNGLNDVRVDPATNFINGAATTVFTAGHAVLDKIDYVSDFANNLDNDIMNSSLISSSNNLYNTVTNVDLNVYKDAIKNLSTKIVKENLEVYYKEETNKLENAILDMPGYIVRRTTYWTMSSIKSVSQLTQELTKNIEDVRKENSKKDEQRRTQEKILEVKRSIGEIKDKYITTVNSVSYGVDTITQYIQNGPEWIEKNLSRYITNVVLDPTENWISCKVDDGIKMVYGFADSLAEKLGTEAAELINKAAKWAIQKALILAMKLKQFALNLAKSVLEKAKNLLAAKLGIGLV